MESAVNVISTYC